MNSVSDLEKAVWVKELTRNRLSYPCESVIRFVAAASKRLPPPGDAIDIGFGSGQHLKLFLDYGYRTHGTELAENSIAIGQSLLEGHQLAGSLILGDIDHSDLQSDFYSLGCAWGVVFLKNKEGILWNLKHIRQILKPKGEFVLNFRAKETWFYGLGKELSEDYFLLDARAQEYKGYHYTFVDEPEAMRICKKAGFKIMNIERAELYKNNMADRHVWYTLWLQRPDDNLLTC